ncbi:MAG: DNA-binding response regulator [Verrucomicrobiaceae bacterium]|nr:MAG: DNA-binding response regulator [Verrucomicrobiaceae bacterium]
MGEMSRLSKDSKESPAGRIERPRVLLAACEAVYLLGLRTIFASQESLEIVGEATTSHTLLPLLTHFRPEILLMSFRLYCGHDALGLAREFSERSPETAVIVLLPGNAVPLTGRLLSTGIRGLLARCARPEAFLPTIEKVLDGEVFVDPELSATRPRPESTAGQVDPSVLTSRELEVLRLFGLGNNYKEVASHLGLSIKTVESHRENIKGKLHLGSAASLHLVAKAYVMWESSGVDYLI